MKYIITWSMLVNTPMPCPNHEVDPFNQGGLVATCLVYHYKVDTVHKSMVFDDRKDAFALYYRGLNTYGIDSLKIDSFYAKQLP